MATLKLNKKPVAAKKTAPGEEQRRGPVRGKGVSRPRQTLEQAQAERAQKQADFERRRAEEAARFERYGRPDPRAAQDQRPPRPRREGDGPQQRQQHSQHPQRQDRPMGDRPAGFRRDEPQDGRHADQRRQAYGQRRDDGPRFDQPRQQPYQQREDRPAQRPAPQRQDQRRRTGPQAGNKPAGPNLDAYKPNQPQYPRSRPQQRPFDDDDDDDDFAVHRDTSAEGDRLSKRMAALGMASRREADEWIAAGLVKVNGKLAELGQRVLPDVKIEVDPLAFKQQAQQVTILLHKPIGYVSGQAEDGYEPASVLVKSGNQWKDDASGIKFHIGHARGLAPAGRLDIDSTGLLVLTQDGRVAKTLIGEDSKVEKEYLVRVEYEGPPSSGNTAAAPRGERGSLGRPGAASDGQGTPMQRVPPQSIKLLNHGLSLDDVQLKPAKVSWINDDQLRFVLKEGRKRQIRRMCELVGLKVVGLKRVRIGRINLGHLPVGQWRFLSPWEKFD